MIKEDIDFILYNKAWINSRAPHLCEKIDKTKINFLLKKGGLLIRNIYNFNNSSHRNFWFIAKTANSWQGIDALSKKTRKLVRRAHRRLDIRKISKEEMLNLSYPVYEAAFQGYQVKSIYLSEDNYKKYLLSLSSDYEFWGCFIPEKSKLIAFSICHLYDDICEYEMSKADPSYLNDYYPMYGMYYARNKYYLGESICRYVSSGSRTITEHSGIQDFLIDKFNFERLYCDIQVEYKWWLKILIKVLYPLRHYITLKMREKNPYLMKVWALLYMEEIQRKSK